MRKLFTTLFIASTVFVQAQAQQKIDFKLNPEKGKVIPYEMTLKTDIEGAQSLIMDMKMNMNMTAVDISDNSIKYETKYTKVTADVNAGIINMAYDSSKEPANQMEEMMASQLKPLLENALTLTMDKKGKVTQIDFPNVSEQAFDKSSMQNITVSFPEHPIAIGESWESNVELAALNAKGNTKNTLAEKTAEGYKINIEGTYTDESGNSLGNVKGYYILDPKTFSTKFSSVNTVIEVQGNKVSSTAEFKLK
ncbi:DUF6263 family protein [Sphingobacterium sp. Mn56C]|uniref:DUF6263 family protein n=1 Tax=Sphingobacterium sp. Mn56C TaxID=3395261 RepID=UPI003BE725B2